MKILITGGKSAAAFKLIKAFSQDQVILGDYGDVPSFASAAYTMISFGERNDDITAHQLLNVCLDRQVELLIPIHYFEVAAVSRSMVLFEEFGIRVLLPEMSVLPELLQEGTQTVAAWAVYQEGQLLYAAQAGKVPVIEHSERLNGVFHLLETSTGIRPVLYTIGD
ncbi:hypothetical protein PBAL39_19724 [Pedobacter sp. BAL39]|uniref:hypothetical protein n=1 Tax=Pedobacter sp. BAL39 TaxID=391596 RepID=UPI0001559421|nr:hypothetical protein [Pedobacter sp. BAL39]EDM36146.1 hypothetical protein PBAL39_19724 [Pedobacter sp. BAL39]